ncbi:putative mitochondrial outer membrane protein [Escovopsis weberi]|uniref:Putative mitochondrial outer membrane protein n=1 Tax=Escovopsis weberi TaxID=150374 RepID=A0A0M8MVJ2_ESCWE|nr:putative mitochondrial outer membrane protein [Escovopsis weberi]
MCGAAFTSVAPYHIISYGTLLGTTFFHSFLNGPVMFRTVTRPTFSAVQSGLFPIYFGMQTVLPIVLALTFPGSSTTHTGISGILDDSHRLGSLVPVATMFATGLLNLAILLPATMKVMKERRGQAKRDGKEWYESGPQSDEMRALSKKFGILHGISSLLNLGTFIAALTYGFTLASRIQ